MTDKPNLLAIGGAHLDRRGRLSVAYVPGASNPGTMREEVGGGVFNAARMAAQGGVTPVFLSVRGGDAPGALVAQAIRQAGMADLSSTFLDRKTASYTAILDWQGDIIAALADMAIYETALPRQIARRKTRDAIAAADAVLTDANMPAEAIARLLDLAAAKPVFAIAISPAKAVRFAGLLGKLACLFMNVREAKALAGLDQDADAPPAHILICLAELGLKRAVMTDGALHVWLMDGQALAGISPPAALRIADATGAGDALAGVATAALMRGHVFEDAVRCGIAAAVATVESPDAVVTLSKNSRYRALLRALGAAGLSKDWT